MEFLAAIAAVCVLVWSGVILLRGGPLAGCLLFMAAATCLSADFFSFNAGGLRLTIDRVLWGVVMLLYLVWRQRGWTEPKPLQAADKAALALVAYLAVRTLLTDPHGTGLTPVVNLVLCYVMPLGIYWVVRQSRIDRPQNTMVLACLALFGIYLAVTVIAERFEAYCLVYPRYIVTSMSRQDGRIRGARPRSAAAAHGHRHPTRGLLQRGLDVLAALRAMGTMRRGAGGAGFRLGLL